jgi:hypothetical protein
MCFACADPSYQDKKSSTDAPTLSLRVNDLVGEALNMFGISDSERRAGRERTSFSLVFDNVNASLQLRAQILRDVQPAKIIGHHIRRPDVLLIRRTSVLGWDASRSPCIAFEASCSSAFIILRGVLGVG